MSTQVKFEITSGLPFSKVINITLPTGRTWWTNVNQFEVLMQIREQPTKYSKLILDMTQYLTVQFSSTNLLRVSLSMTGEDTRTFTKSGYYDLVISDTGLTDARAFVIIKGQAKRKILITSEQEQL